MKHLIKFTLSLDAYSILRMMASLLCRSFQGMSEPAIEIVLPAGGFSTLFVDITVIFVLN